MLVPGGDQINPGGVDIRVPEDVRQLRQILLHLVKGPGEQVAKIVGENLSGCDLRLFAEALHFFPNVASI